MCDPVTLAAATFAIGTASAVTAYQGQQRAFDAQEAMNKAATKNAIDAANQTYQATQTRMQQEVAAVSTEKMNANIAAAEARATANTAAGESGVQGNSVSQLLASYYSKQGRYNEALDTNLQMNRQALTDSMDQTRFGTISTINSLPRGEGPSFLDAAIRVAGSGLSAGSNYYTMTNYG